MTPQALDRGEKGENTMSQTVESLKLPVGRTGIVAGLVLGVTAIAMPAFAQEARTDIPSRASERLLLPAGDETNSNTAEEVVTDAPASTTLGDTKAAAPSFEDLDSAATNLNDALSGARAKLDELRQATELAAMAAELREELENSIQENNRLAASLAESQSERGQLQSQHNAAQREIFELRQSVESSSIEIENQQQMLEQRQARIDVVEEAKAEAEATIQSLDGDLSQASSEIDKLTGEIRELTGQLEATRTELDTAQERAKEARTARDEADQELAKVRKQIAGMLRSVLLGGEPIDVSAMEEAEADGQGGGLGLSVRYEAIQASNVRAEPTPESERVGFAKRGDLLTVIGKVGGRNWFEVETEDGVRGYIFGDLIRPAA